MAEWMIEQSNERMNEWLQMDEWINYLTNQQFN